MLKVEEAQRLKQKKNTLEESLADTLKLSRARRSSGRWRKGLSVGAAPGTERHKAMDAYIVGLARFQVGCSARFNDLQHVHPKHITQPSKSAWQTKRSNSARCP